MDTRWVWALGLAPVLAAAGVAVCAAGWLGLSTRDDGSLTGPVWAWCGFCGGPVVVVASAVLLLVAAVAVRR
jgi:hypothetical protein